MFCLPVSPTIQASSADEIDICLSLPGHVTHSIHELYEWRNCPAFVSYDGLKVDKIMVNMA